MEEPLDLSGLKCPLPALMARRALARLAAGETLIVVATDPLAAVDIPHMCAEEGHAVESVAREEEKVVFRIRRKS
jgi:tRNA 2-thiouridine synthesizing protein A